MRVGRDTASSSVCLPSFCASCDLLKRLGHNPRKCYHPSSPPAPPPACSSDPSHTGPVPSSPSSSNSSSESSSSSSSSSDSSDDSSSSESDAEESAARGSDRLQDQLRYRAYLRSRETSWVWFVGAVYELHNHLRHTPAAELPVARSSSRLRNEIFAILNGEEDSRTTLKGRRSTARPDKKSIGLQKKGPAPGPCPPPEPYWAADFQ